MMTVEEAITGRRSIRAFLPEPVPRELVERILIAAGRAPSGSNTQPWRVRVLMGKVLEEVVAEIKAHHDSGQQGHWEYAYYPRNWREPYLARRRACGFGLYNAAGIARGDTVAMHEQHGRNFVFFGAPVGMIFTIDRDMEIGAWLDYGMFLQSIMILARQFGLETCSQAAFATRHAILERQLAIPPEQMVVCGMALGYADPGAAVNGFVTERMALEEFVTFVDHVKKE
ncbi:MAG: nitroreductase [Hyphomicrobiaceae bacterium]|nr:MAG: nitroreductase [Hyphomicrobiaceae bacterium]